MAMAQRIPQVRDYMTRTPLTVDSNEPIRTVREFMKKNNIRHLPVVKGEAILGIVSERAVVMALELKGSEGYKAGDIMIPHPYIVEPHTPLDEVVAVMAEEKYGCVIVQEDSELVGIFTTVDACRVLREYLEKTLDH